VINVFFELDRLRSHLITKGVDEITVEQIVSRASAEINSLAMARGQEAIDEAVQIGAQQESADFINQLRLDTLNFEVTTESGQLRFTEPPKPMLPFLLKNAKPMKDGSGVYKVIPVGKPGNKPSFAKNIIDEQRRISAERIEAAKTRAKAIAPAGSQIFRTATSKQDPTTKWVQSAKEKNFTDDVASINQNLKNSLDDSIKDIISKYEDLF
jgi:ribosomal protein L12E/L44/L45/RPP1/RPP2